MTILSLVNGRGVLASRPAAGSPGRNYFVTDGTPGLYRDNGSSWDSIGESGAVVTWADLDDDHDAHDHTGVPGVGAGGSGGADEYVLDVPPGSAHAKDDEFAGASLDAKWAAITSNAGNEIATSFVTEWLSLEPNAAGSANTARRVFGIRQVAPAGSFTISARIQDGASVDLSSGVLEDFSIAGIFVARTASTRAIVWGHKWWEDKFAAWQSTNGYSETADWGASAAGADFNPLYPRLGELAGLWYRMIWDSAAGTIKLRYSANGLAWVPVVTLSGESQPDRIGLAMYASPANVTRDHILRARHFRVTEP